MVTRAQKFVAIVGPTAPTPYKAELATAEHTQISPVVVNKVSALQVPNISVTIAGVTPAGKGMA